MLSMQITIEAPTEDLLMDVLDAVKETFERGVRRLEYAGNGMCRFSFATGGDPEEDEDWWGEEPGDDEDDDEALDL